MSYIDELADDEDDAVIVDKGHIQRRVDDWLHRLTVLYAEISIWADQTGWSHASGTPVSMHEELMQRAGLPARDQPSLILTPPKGERIWFKPKGLWVIGANGRIDIYTLRDLLLLVDTAQQFQSPCWVLHHLPSRAAGGEAFSASLLLQLA